MQVPGWRNVFILKNSLTPLSLRAIISSSSSSSSRFAYFHSSSIASEKKKDKWNHDFCDSQSQRPPKNYVRYVVRHKRADARKALKDLLFNHGCPKISFQEESSTWRIDVPGSGDAEQDEHSYNSTKKGRSKSSNRHGRKAQQKRSRRKFRRDYSSEEDYSPETVFHGTFGNGKKWSTWSFNPSTSGFEWRKEPEWTNKRRKEWETAGETESDNESCVVGSYSDRVTLGLPPTGHLKIEDVKNAFRLSALRWHPDKHQGPSQARAEEKFKVCVDAYKSLCNALSRV